MKLALLLGFATSVSVISTIAIVFFYEPPMKPQRVYSFINSKDIKSYIAQKGTIEKRTTLSFDQLLAQSAPTVLSAHDDISADPIAASDSAVVTKLPQKSSYTISFLGDSMIDTLGPTIPDVQTALKSAYPKQTFKLINHGAGATTIDTGLNHLTEGYSYLGVQRPSVLSQNPDIIVIESFAYNHWNDSQSDLDRQWLTIAKIVDTIKHNNPNTAIILAASIAPHCPTFTDGSANLPPERKYSECQTVKKYLQNMVNFATSQHFLLADAYHPSLIGSDGDPRYINQGDHIHPSDKGKELFAEEVLKAIKKVL